MRRELRPLDAASFRLESTLATIGPSYRGGYARFGDFWQSHIENSRRMVLAGAAQVRDLDSVVVLGASEGRDNAIEELLEEYGDRIQRVIVIDMDGEGMQQLKDRITRLNPAWGDRIEVQVMDVTGGRLKLFVDLAVGKIRTLDDKEAATRAISELMQELTERYVDFGSLHPNSYAGEDEYLRQLRCSCVISSGLTSQLITDAFVPIVGAFLTQFHEKAGIDLNLHDLLHEELVQQHANLLASLVEDGGRIYWADTFVATPDPTQLDDQELLAVRMAMMSIVKRWPVEVLEHMDDALKVPLGRDLGHILNIVIENDEEALARANQEIGQFRQTGSTAELDMAKIGRDLLFFTALCSEGDGTAMLRVPARYWIALIEEVSAGFSSLFLRKSHPIFRRVLIDSLAPAGLMVDPEVPFSLWRWILNPPAFLLMRHKTGMYLVSALVAQKSRSAAS